MRATCTASACCALAFALAAAAWAAAAQADDAAPMYDPSTVYAIDLDLPQASVETLEDFPVKDYVQGFITLAPTDGTPGSEGTPLIDHMEVGIRLKGSEGGSFRDLADGKSGFKVKCNFVSGEKCLGLKKMTLNNMVQDPSMVHETLAYEAFRANGVPAPHTGYAYLRVNGEDFGVYLNLETYDDVFLERELGGFDDDIQHLYEGEYGDDVAPGGAEGFEVDEGEEGPGKTGDLEALIEATNGTGGSPWSDRVEPHAELLEMTRMWAVEKYIDHWDGYSGHAIPGFRPNNYYLYSDPDGRFQMLPWGTDQAWVFTEGVPGREVTFDGEGGVLFDKCLEDEECFQLYWGALSLVTHTMPGLDPAALAEARADLLAPWQEEEETNGTRGEHSAGEVEDAVEESLDFIASRQAEAEAWLAENEPPEPDTENEPSKPDIVDDDPTVPIVNPTPGPSSNPPPLPSSITIERVKRSGRHLVVDVRASGPGRIDLWASFKAGKKRRLACEKSKRVRAAGGLVLRCPLSRAAMERLGRRALRLRLVTKIALADGGGKTIAEGVRLARL